ncbi:hypothetical protein NKY68_00195 [Sinorhizobium meliloti]|uniref:hypothetical protein n=1 Tax=Rhizobium meliloti TaxID=382 RepID=UPI003D647049
MKILMPSVIAAIVALSVSYPLAREADIPAQSELSPVNGVDLGIADDETFRRPNSWSKLQNRGTKYAEAPVLGTERLLGGGLSGPASRPGMSIAWRNAAQIEEVEVRVRNLGNTAGEGKLWVDVTDDEGAILLHLEPPEEMRVVRIPAFADGGREGKIIRMKASRELNNLIDRFDLERRRYNVRATVETVSAIDVNPQDNIKTKSWNIPFRVEPGFTNHFNYKFKNQENTPIKVRWLFERTPYPPGWELSGIPTDTSPFELVPGQEIKGTLSLSAPEAIDEGAFLESRIALVNDSTGLIYQQHEWFQVYDTVPPIVADYRIVLTNDHRIAVQVLVADQGSGVLEATGVSTQFSTDGGRTFASRPHNYKAGNFVVPTLFESVLGPFAPNTNVQLRFLAKDTAGNVTSIIPDAATAIKAPQGAERLLDLAYIFPRTQPNAIFALEPGKTDVGQIASDFAAAIATGNKDAAQVDAVARALAELPISSESKEALLDSAETLSRIAPQSLTASRFQDVVEGLAVTPSSERDVLLAPINRIEAPGSSLLKMSTIGLTVE